MLPGVMVTGTEPNCVLRAAAAPIWLPPRPVTNDTPGNPYIEHEVPEVFWKSSGTYVLPAAPPVWLVSAVTAREEVAHGASPFPPVGLPAGLGGAEGEAAADEAVALADGAWLDAGGLPELEGADVTWWPPEEPHAASSSAAAAARGPAAIIRRAVTETVIIHMPFVFAVFAGKPVSKHCARHAGLPSGR
jgi:hypothetical protein